MESAMNDNSSDDGKKQTVMEEIKVSGANLLDKVKALAKQGNVRTLKIIAEDGDVFLKTPLNVGLVVGGVVVLAAPWLAILGAVAALVSEAKIVIERDKEPGEP